MKNWKVLTSGILVFAACKKPYNPPAITAPGGYLVVEGVINPGPDSTIIKLSHTVNISTNNVARPVAGATLAVESDQHTLYPLTDAGNGTYVSAGLNLDNSHTYRLDIKTPDSKQYQSKLEPVMITPPIDSIGFNITTVPETGIQIYANTHSANNNLRYYRWDYDEIWEFHSKYIAVFISNGSILIERTPAQYVSTCYSNDISADVVLGSSDKLSQNILYQQPILFIPSTSEKIESRYRVVVRQYALTHEAFDFWTNLKKNTEQLGSIFDALPSEIAGNIHCITNPAEPVIGYLSVSTVASKTKFIYNSQLPAWVTTYPYSCTLDTASIGSPNYRNLVLFPDVFLATDPIGPIINPSGYWWTTRECADCTIRAGKIPPPFWK